MKRRVAYCGLVIIFSFSVLLCRYFILQVLQSKKWSSLADSQHILIVKAPSKRGVFYSNTSLKLGMEDQKVPFIVDLIKYHLYIDPLSIPDCNKAFVAKKLIEFTGVNPSVKEELYKKSRSRRFAMWIDRERKQSILDWWKGYAKKNKIPRNAIYFVTDYKRTYPYNHVLGHVLHTIRDMKDEVTQEAFPTGGMEAYYNNILQGKYGKRKLLRSPLNHLELDTIIEHPENGADIWLTVNHVIQTILEEELEIGANNAKAKGAMGLILEANTGNIIALGQYPSFNPENYTHYFNNKELIETTKIRAVTDAFEVGSIIKPITMSISLEANKQLLDMGEEPAFDPEEKSNVTRTIFPGREKHPLRDIPSHKYLNMNMALQKSSNIYMAQTVEKVIQKMGVDWYRSALTNIFGFETKTGIELPGESIGLVPSQKRMHKNGTYEWTKSTPYSIAIGYNILATPLQMARAFAVIVNGGYLVEPTLVKKITKVDNLGNTYNIPVNENRAPRKVISSESVELVKNAMKFTTQQGGTGRLAAVEGFTEGGKTGTAQKIENGNYVNKYLSSFVGFVPATSDGKFIIIVTVDEPFPGLTDGLKGYMGGRCAAPIFNKIASRMLNYLGSIPDDKDSSKQYKDWELESKQLLLKYKEWN